MTTVALRDIKEIEVYSIENWGRKTANKYISEFDVALSLIEQDLGLLRPIVEFSSTLKFYRVRSHYLVCDILEETIFILTVVHGNMDIMQRLNELEPTLKYEVELLRNK